MHPASISLQWLRRMSWLEGGTLLLLVLVAVPLKRLAGWPEVVSVMGPIHGAAFLLYGGMVLQALGRRRIGSKDAAQLLLAAFVPFGAFLLGGLFRKLQRIDAGRMTDPKAGI